MNQIVNFKPVTIGGMQPGDTIYVTKMHGQCSVTHFCEFVKYEKGLVHARIISTHPDWAELQASAASTCPEAISNVITARLQKCYLWGRPPWTESDHRNAYCCWFTTKNLKAGE